MPKNTVLSVENLTVRIGRRQAVTAVSDVSFDIKRGECFALVGESGCGKSLTALSLMRLLPEGVFVSQGRVKMGGQDLMRLT